VPTVGTVVVMVRQNRVRLADDELDLVDDAAEEYWGDNAADDIPRGKTIGQLAREYLLSERGGGK